MINRSGKSPGASEINKKELTKNITNGQTITNITDIAEKFEEYFQNNFINHSQHTQHLQNITHSSTTPKFVKYTNNLTTYTEIYNGTIQQLQQLDLSSFHKLLERDIIPIFRDYSFFSNFCN